MPLVSILVRFLGRGVMTGRWMPPRFLGPRPRPVFRRLARPPAGSSREGSRRGTDAPRVDGAGRAASPDRRAAPRPRVPETRVRQGLTANLLRWPATLTRGQVTR